MRPRAFPSACVLSLPLSLLSSPAITCLLSSLPLLSFGWPPRSSLQTVRGGALSHPHPPLLCSPAVPSLLIVPVKQLADVTFNYGGISSGAVEAERTEQHSEQRRSCITICHEVIYLPYKVGGKGEGGVKERKNRKGNFSILATKRSNAF